MKRTVVGVPQDDFNNVSSRSLTCMSNDASKLSRILLVPVSSIDAGVVAAVVVVVADDDDDEVFDERRSPSDVKYER